MHRWALLSLGALFFVCPVCWRRSTAAEIDCQETQCVTCHFNVSEDAVSSPGRHDATTGSGPCPDFFITLNVSRRRIAVCVPYELHQPFSEPNAPPAGLRLSIVSVFSGDEIMRNPAESRYGVFTTCLLSLAVSAAVHAQVPPEDQIEEVVVRAHHTVCRKVWLNPLPCSRVQNWSCALEPRPLARRCRMFPAYIPRALARP